ncbi:MAG: glycosyltransferase family 2 protein [Lachnospiraceae bacterium]|nr:glycosyltransferase family 2 protein [Lachnospiraceae bacterium]
MKKISICVCCYNEEENIELMYQALSEQMKKVPEYDYEILFEDNDSEDATVEILRRIAEKDKKVKGIVNQTNFGPDRSTVNCMRHMTGDAYIGIPCDFQEPPEMIPEFIREWEKGHDIVWGQKLRSKENPLKRACRNLFYSIIDLFSENRQIRHVIGFGIMDRKVIDIILDTLIQDPEINIRYAISEYGFDIKLIPYSQQKRLRGKSSYSFSKYYSFAITSLCNTSVKPLRIMTVLGMLVALFSILVAVFYFVYKITHWDSFDAGMAPLVIGMFFVAAVQLFSIGLLGEYVGVLIRKVTDKPVVVEKEVMNIDRADTQKSHAYNSEQY